MSDRTLYFSRAYQQREMSPDRPEYINYNYHEGYDGRSHAVASVDRPKPAFLYESADGTCVVACTGVGSLGHEDEVNLGPAGRFLYAYHPGRHCPTEPLVFPRDRLDDLKSMNLTEEDLAAGREAARELAEAQAPSSPAP